MNSSLRSKTRGNASEPGNEVSFFLGGVRVSPADLTLRSAHNDHQVGALVMRGLIALNRERGNVVSRNALVEACWGNRIVGDDSVHQLLLKLRKLGDEFDGAFTVETIRGVGYRLVAKESHRRAFTSRRLLIAGGLAALLGLLATAWVLGSTRDRTPVDPVLVVLPFTAPGAGAGNQAFAEGLGEEVLTNLGREKGIRTIGRFTAAMLDRSADLTEVGDKTGATHLLEGSVRRDGTQARLNVRLVDVSNGVQLWAESYQGDVKNLPHTAEHVSRKVVQQLVGGDARETPQTESSASTAVYDLYLRAQALARSRVYADVGRAIELLEQAIALDPDYAPAYARIAEYRYIRDQQRPTGAYQDSARERQQTEAFARRALALQPSLAEAHAAMGMLTWTSYPATALRHDRRALQLDPGNYLAWNSGANALGRMCRSKEAAEWYSRARDIEPLLATPYVNLASALAAEGKPDEARAMAQLYRRRSGDEKGFHRIATQIALNLGNASAAALHARAALRNGATDPQTKLALAQALFAMRYRREAIEHLPRASVKSIGAYWQQAYARAAQQPLRLGGEQDQMEQSAIARSMVRAGNASALVGAAGSARTILAQSPCLMIQEIPPLAAAMRKAGRPEEAALLVRSARDYLSKTPDGDRASGDGLALRAELMIMSGDPAAALRTLSAAVAAGWIEEFRSAVSLDDPAFAPLTASGEFAQVRRSMQETVRRERAEYRRQLSHHDHGPFYQ